jgi:hypothetical protein
MIVAVPGQNWMIRFACCCALAGYAPAWQATEPRTIKRLYVEPFVTKTGGDRLRQDVIAELRKMRNSSIGYPPRPGAYPIASFTWLVVPVRIADDARRNAIAGFLRWMLGLRQRQAAALGYLALPRDVVTKEEDAILSIH